MGKVTGFLEIDRQDRRYAPACDRIRHWREFVIPLSEEATRDQAARCMNCGIPYCHTGCPVNNQIPDWNDLVYRNDWQDAILNLHSTNNFPEFTGRICPAPCEAACTLNLIESPVTIKTIECVIVDRAWENGWVKPEPPTRITGKKVAIVGSGPAGLACAQQLCRAGHEVHVYEKLAKAGGLLTYGIPDFKMEKRIVFRRIAQMEAEGVIFHYNAHVGRQRADRAAARRVRRDRARRRGGEEPRPADSRARARRHPFRHGFPAAAEPPRGNEPLGDVQPILAGGKHVVVIGGGDTGSDCIGTAIRQGALSVTNLEIMTRPPDKEDKLNTWPNWPYKLRTSSSHEEGAERDFAVLTQEFVGKHGRVKTLKCVRCDEKFKPIAGTEFELKADLVLLAMGFVHPVHEGMIESLKVDLDQRGNVKADTVSYRSSIDKVYACGDMRRGQSLVVWAIREGRQTAHAIDEFLMGSTTLPL